MLLLNDRSEALVPFSRKPLTVAILLVAIIPLLGAQCSHTPAAVEGSALSTISVVLPQGDYNTLLVELKRHGASVENGSCTQDKTYPKQTSGGTVEINETVKNGCDYLLILSLGDSKEGQFFAKYSNRIADKPGEIFYSKDLTGGTIERHITVYRLDGSEKGVPLNPDQGESNLTIDVEFGDPIAGEDKRPEGGSESQPKPDNGGNEPKPGPPAPKPDERSSPDGTDTPRPGSEGALTLSELSLSVPSGWQIKQNATDDGTVILGFRGQADDHVILYARPQTGMNMQSVFANSVTVAKPEFTETINGRAWRQIETQTNANRQQAIFVNGFMLEMNGVTYFGYATAPTRESAQAAAQAFLAGLQ